MRRLPPSHTHRPPQTPRQPQGASALRRRPPSRSAYVPAPRHARLRLCRRERVVVPRRPRLCGRARLRVEGGAPPCPSVRTRGGAGLPLRRVATPHPPLGAMSSRLPPLLPSFLILLRPRPPAGAGRGGWGGAGYFPHEANTVNLMVQSGFAGALLDGGTDALVTESWFAGLDRRGHWFGHST